MPMEILSHLPHISQQIMLLILMALLHAVRLILFHSLTELSRVDVALSTRLPQEELLEQLLIGRLIMQRMLEL